ncbi:alpha/beta hydrolase family protein [Agriterribacter sp.]|uniref:alpha/beta hydrolase n=1 Tax=Agriterribacter sp. TaxID=2821509 RepID=UPI002CAC7FD1|nr:alpha/beta hydrolase family protein [Agriterribacter sp.]HRO46657.1 alpha/beta hydrolase family protein [Agriterribacter sp.]HRQ17318.1 alpha/beta hydrolase family protein [Agriterribacter sp.]
MKAYLLFFLSLCATPVLYSQQPGKVIEEASVSSTILGRDVSYTVYLPADYEHSQRTYPVVYLLHGYTDDNTGWLQFGEINRYADKAIAEGTIPPMIIIMPDADSSWYINAYDGKEKYEDFFIQEFIPAIEKTYRIKSQKKYRAVAGLSMGGYGSLLYALKYPEYFVATAPLSAAVFSDDEMINMPDAQWDRTFGQLYGRGLKGKARLSKAWYDNSALSIIEKKSGAELNKVRYWIDCGDDDFLAKGNALLHIALRSKLVAHEYRVRDGAHSWTYWRTGITDALAFIGDSFRQK